jgi:hypothetical protein
VVILKPTPDVAKKRITIGLVVRKPIEVVRACCATLKAQRLPPDVEIRYHAILDTEVPEVIHEVADLLCVPGQDIVETEIPVEGDFADDGPVTHQWTGTAMERVGRLKTRILRRALADGADAVWLVDADLLCGPETLRSLWYADVPVVSAVFWTRWVNDPMIHAAPQVWLRHPYVLDGRGYPDEASFRRRLLSRQLTRVWGLGACTLIRCTVLQQGVTFDYVPGVSREGMMAGEDRHFCLQCESRHIPMYADPWPHIFHVYHARQIPEIDARMAALVGVSTTDPKAARWLNVRLRMLEPVPTGPGTFGHVAPHVVRARVGAAELLPDLEAQCLRHLDGLPFIAAIHYPATYEVDWLRGQRRLMEVTVIDAKTDAPQPTIDDEVAGAYDLTMYTHEQQESMHAI